MSITTKQQHQQHEGEVRSPKQQNTDQQQSRSNSNNRLLRQQQQWHEGKSVDTPPGHSSNKQPPTLADRHVTRKYKSLTKQTPVRASTETGGGGSEEDKRQPSKAHSKEENIECDETLNSYSDIYETPPDYRIYQEGKLQDFFQDNTSSGGKEKRPKTIADVCLVNDHYILVKMPENKPEAVKAERKQNCQQVRFCQSVDDAQRAKRKMYHYLGSKGNRIRKIAPISEEPEYMEPSGGGSTEEPAKSHSPKSRHCLSVNACWQVPEEDVEVYETRTKIQKSPTKTLTLVQEVERFADKSSQTMQIEENIVQNSHRPQEIQSISGTILTSSLQDRVTLLNYGSLIASNNNLDLGHCRKSCTPQRRQCLRFDRFHWLLRPFRGKYRKPKPKIQAVVYKSYFVKWTKPPETRHHGFGSVKLTELGSSVLRRCRSAIF